MLQYDLFHGNSPSDPNKTVVVYYHSGGLQIGEADSEYLLADASLRSLALQPYGIQRRLPTHVASRSRCLPLRLPRRLQLRVPVRPRGAIDSVVLRCPVTSDAFNGPQYVPEWLRPLHTTANMKFQTSLLGIMKRRIPRDGLERMPLEAGKADLRGQPRHWIRVCTNDMLFSDGVCYAML